MGFFFLDMLNILSLKMELIFSRPVVAKNDIDEKVGTEIVKNFSYDLKI